MTQKSPSTRAWALPLGLALMAALALASWFLRGVPRDVPEGGDSELQCVSYAPYRLPGETPLDPQAHVSAARIEEDLRIIAARSKCVRTYSVDQGLDAVPRVARALGMKVLLGAWIGRNRAENEVELTKAIALTHQFPETIRGLIVGNEVLLRRELPEEALIAYIERARHEGAAPVTYADVWEFWQEHPALAGPVSFVTIHILPYWEDEPIGIDGAIEHILQVARRMKEIAAGKEILIGETGWPSEGKARRAAVPGRVEQARFMRQFAAAALAEGLRYNVIEAFDQPWKRRLEGAMGGYWGLFDSQGVAKFPWTGPVEEDPGWRRGPWAGAFMGVLLALVALMRRRGLAETAIWAIAGLGMGAGAAFQWGHMTHWNRNAIEWAVSGLFAVTVWLLYLASVEWLLCRRRPASTARADLPSAAASWRDWHRGGRLSLPGAIALLRLLMLAGAAGLMILLVFDARYRGMPTWLYLPAATVALIAWLDGARAPRDAREEHLLSAVVLLSCVALVVMERPVNLQADAFAAVLLLWVGASTAFRYGLGGVFRGRQAVRAASRTPTADGS